MTDRTSLRISCSECQGDPVACADCLVGFFTTERDAEVRPFRVRSRQPAPATAEHLPADLDTALANLEAAGLDPELLDLTPNSAARAS